MSVRISIRVVTEQTFRTSTGLIRYMYLVCDAVTTCTPRPRRRGDTVLIHRRPADLAELALVFAAHFSLGWHFLRGHAPRRNRIGGGFRSRALSRLLRAGACGLWPCVRGYFTDAAGLYALRVLAFACGFPTALRDGRWSAPALAALRARPRPRRARSRLRDTEKRGATTARPSARVDDGLRAVPCSRGGLRTL